MKSPVPALLGALILVVAIPVAAAATHHHEGNAGGAARLELNAGKKWASDAHLRQAMSAINEAMARALPQIHADRFAPADYQALAATVGDKVAYAVANCRLEPKADAMLHLILADLVAGAETMGSGKDKPRHDGAVQVLGALKAYGRHFRHPGWQVAG